jgi:hypothetical protein
MVTQCQNPTDLHTTTKPTIRCTPAPAANSTGTARAVRPTAKPARPKRNIPMPAAAHPATRRPATSTAAVMAHGAGRHIANSFFIRNPLMVA